MLPDTAGPVAGGEFSSESSEERNSGSGGGVDCDRCLEVSEGKGEGTKADDQKQLQAEEVINGL